MAASRVGGYHVRPPTTWPGRTPTSRSGETHPPRGRLAVQARREPLETLWARYPHRPASRGKTLKDR